MKERWIALLAVLSMAVAIGSLSTRQALSAPKCIDVSIGRIYGGWTSHQASLRRLSQEIKKTPQGDVYIIRREIFFIGIVAKKTKLMTKYDRRTQALYDDRYGDGTSYLWQRVTDKAIHAVAALPNSTFEDLAKFGCVRVHHQTPKQRANKSLHPPTHLPPKR